MINNLVKKNTFNYFLPQIPKLIWKRNPLSLLSNIIPWNTLWKRNISKYPQ